MKTLTTTCLLWLICACVPAPAEVRLPSFFGDHMILQQKTSNAIWGWGDADEEVTVEASWGAQAKATCNDRGKWILFLETPSPGTGHTLTIRGSNQLEIHDVAIGEVWLCAGQSNMGWSTGNSFAAEGETTIDLPGLRIFRSAREHWHEPLEENRDLLSQWKPCDPASAAETSAVSYYFAKTLHLELGIPVGIIQRAYAGTPIEGWIPWELQKDDPRAQEHKAALDAGAVRRIRNGETVERALATFDAELADYRARISAGETMKNSVRPLAPPIITRPSNLGHQYPAHIFNAMIAPVQPYGIRGVLWYQGERNSKNVPQAHHYRSQLTQLIDYYRTSWHELSRGNVPADVPFQFTQLPSWNPPQNKPVEGLEAPWAVNREAMRLVSREVPRTGMVVTIDTGDAVELHPKNKKPIGIRHALLALNQTYGKKVVASGPRFEKQSIQGNEVTLTFSSTGSGLTTARPGPPAGFAIAGNDRQWHWAEAAIVDDTVVLSSPQIPEPVAVRYAWAMNPSQQNLLYNKEGLPASPFRSDDWPLFDPVRDEVVEVHKPDKPDGYVATDWDRPAMTQLSTPETVEEPSEVSNGLAPEVTDLNAEDISFALEANLPDLKEPFLTTSPAARQDGIPVGKLGTDGGDRDAILSFAREIAAGDHGKVDSLLICADGKLLFESYFRRGRINFPHYQMSITKSYTALALGRAIKLGYFSMANLNRPAVQFLGDLQEETFVPGAEEITLAEALNMRSGIRIDSKRAKELRKTPAQLLGQGQIQAYFENSAPIPPSPRDYKYQGSDPSLTMQVLEAVVPGTAKEFIETELLAKLGITNYAWQEDISGLPKSAAGSSMRSRDMIKWGQLVLNQGRWNGEMLIPRRYMEAATSRLYTNSQGSSYGYFWWRHDASVGERSFDCISGRGAGGQFIMLFPDLRLILVITAHNQGMGKMLTTAPERIVPGFLPR